MRDTLPYGLIGLASMFLLFSYLLILNIGKHFYVWLFMLIGVVIISYCFVIEIYRIMPKQMKMVEKNADNNGKKPDISQSLLPIPDSAKIEEQLPQTIPGHAKNHEIHQKDERSIDINGEEYILIRTYDLIKRRKSYNN